MTGRYPRIDQMRPVADPRLDQGGWRDRTHRASPVKNKPGLSQQRLLDRTLARGRDRMRPSHCALVGNASRGATGRWASPIKGDQMRPIEKNVLWTNLDRDRTHDSSESG
jgi:hypothetical protein